VALSTETTFKTVNKWHVLCGLSVPNSQTTVHKLIHRTQGLHSDWGKRVCHGEFCVLFALPGSSQFSDLLLLLFKDLRKPVCRIYLQWKFYQLNLCGSWSNALTNTEKMV